MQGKLFEDRAPERVTSWDDRLAALLLELADELADRRPEAIARSCEAAVALEKAAPGALHRMTAHLDLRKLGLVD